jgi:Matrixin
MQRLNYFLGALFFGLLASSSPWGVIQGWGATPTLSASGKAVRWFGSKLELAGNPGNASGLSAETVRQAAVRGLQRWAAASSGRVTFDYWQGADRKVYETNSNLNGQSSLYFASQSATPVDSQVLGLTQVWYNTETGQIIETDVVLNDVQFRFSTNPRDTTGYGSGTTTGNTVFLENVLTHELGHAFGLSHSGVLQSTMLFMESPGQNQLACDDQYGLRGVYGAGSGTGSFLIRVQAPDGRMLMGAQVLALSRQRGTVLRASLTDRDGVARLSGLDAGEYDVLVEPYYAGASPLPPYYSGTESRLCSGGGHFKRTFRTASGGLRLEPVRVTAGAEVDAGQLQVSCTSQIQAPSADSAQNTVLSYGESSGAIAALYDASRRRLRIESSGGDLTVRLLSYSLYSASRVRATLWADQGGTPGQGILVSERSPLSTSESGFTNFDTEIRAQGLSPGVYWIELTAYSVGALYYPAGPLSRDTQSFYVAEVIRGGVGTTDSRCRQNESLFGDYQSPPGDPPRRGTGGSDVGLLGACATVRSQKSVGGGTGAMATFMAFLMLYGITQATKLREGGVALATARA